MQSTTLRIDLFTDIVCPWCLIGTVHLEQALAKRPDIDATIVLHPFLLDPTTPESGVSLVDTLRKKYGRDPRPMFTTVENAGRAVGIAFDFSGDPMGYPSVKAHALVALAEEHGAGFAVHRALMDAHFVSRQNICDRQTLRDIGTKHGLDADAVTAILDDGRALQHIRRAALQASSDGIQGVPFFVLNDALAFSGAQPVDVMCEAIDRAVKNKETTSRASE